MDYSKFYTPPEIASLLIEQLDGIEPDKIVDICCGSCNLLLAAKERWKNAILYGIDISDCKDKEVKFCRTDGRKYAIEHPNEFSLVVANPPFDYLEQHMEYPELFEGVFKGVRVSRLEVEMLIANLLTLKDNGVLLIIMPSSFVEADSYIEIRRILAKHYFVKKIIKLPLDTFGVSNINSYALEIEKKQNNFTMTIFKCLMHKEGKYTWNVVGKVDENRLLSGSWTNELNLDDVVDINIKRGNISSSHFKKRGQVILHTAKKSSHWQPSKRYISKKIKPSVFAEEGDVLVSRIGKSAGQWCVYEGEKVPISDCLYRIKDPDGEVLSKIRGRDFGFQKGVATRYITMRDFKAWIYENDSIK